MEIKLMSFSQFLKLDEAELKHLQAPGIAMRNKPNLVDKNHPNHPDSYEYRQKWRGKPKTKAGREGHEVAHDVAKNHARLGSKKTDSFKPMSTGYLANRPHREGNKN